jgi:hypothetical protein
MKAPYLMTCILFFSDHYDVCCKWSDGAFWSICECVDYTEIVLQ